MLKRIGRWIEESRGEVMGWGGWVTKIGNGNTVRLKTYTNMSGIYPAPHVFHCRKYLGQLLSARSVELCA